MGMTLTEKILARASGNDVVRPGDNIWVNADVLMTHDVCGPGTIGIFHREFGDDARVFDREKIITFSLPTPNAIGTSTSAGSSQRNRIFRISTNPGLLHTRASVT
jgi:homoaconitase/3-isopropylmalate dehydratase large subunit